MKFTIGQRVRFYVSREFLEGQRITGNTGWVTGKVYKIWPQVHERSVGVSLDPETNVLCLCKLFSLLQKRHLLPKHAQQKRG